MSTDLRADALCRHFPVRGLLPTSLVFGLLLVGTAGVAEAQAAACARGITAAARAPNGANLVPPQSYNTQNLARSRAIQAWQKTVRGRCSGYSTAWLIAPGKKVDCEGYAGGVSCQVSARPRNLW